MFSQKRPVFTQDVSRYKRDFVPKSADKRDLFPDERDLFTHIRDLLTN